MNPRLRPMDPADLPHRVVSEPVRLAGAPALLVHRSDAQAASRRGTVLLYHGLGVDKHCHLHELKSLARAGFLAVGVDNVGHGERRYPDYEARFAAERSEPTPQPRGIPAEGPVLSYGRR